jgi:Flp pilus assembly pilin Flp
VYSPRIGAIKMTEILGRLRKDVGQGLVEYALILVLIAVVVATTLSVFGGTLANTYQGIVTAF